MREVVISGQRKVEIVTSQDEPLTSTSIRLRTLLSGISHGTEMSFYRGTAAQLTSRIDGGLFVERGADQSVYPIRHGYEMVGRVIEVGDAVDGFEFGDVAWTGSSGHADTFVCDIAAGKKPFFCERAPDGASREAGVFLALGGVAYDGHLTSRLRLGESAVVSGLGVIGLLAVQLAKLAGIEPLIAVDPIPRRRELALAYGADHVIDPGFELVAETVRRVNGGKGVDAVLETSGSWQALHEAVRSCASGYGRVVALGFYQGPGTDLRLGEEFHHSSFQPMGASSILALDHRNVPAPGREWDRDRVYRTVTGLLGSGRLDVGSLVTHTFPQQEAPAAFDLIDRDPEETLKVVLTYD